MGITLPIFGLATEEARSLSEARLKRLRATTSFSGEQASIVAEIVEDVRKPGDAAVVEYMREWTERFS